MPLCRHPELVCSPRATLDRLPVEVEHGWAGSYLSDLFLTRSGPWLGTRVVLIFWISWAHYLCPSKDSWKSGTLGLLPTIRHPGPLHSSSKDLLPKLGSNLVAILSRSIFDGCMTPHPDPARSGLKGSGSSRDRTRRLIGTSMDKECWNSFKMHLLWVPQIGTEWMFYSPMFVWAIHNLLPIVQQ